MYVKKMKRKMQILVLILSYKCAQYLVTFLGFNSSRSEFQMGERWRQNPHRDQERAQRVVREFTETCRSCTAAADFDDFSASHVECCSSRQQNRLSICQRIPHHSQHKCSRTCVGVSEARPQR